MRAGGDLLELLPAIARTISESLGYEAVVINLYRPAWDDFSVTTVHGSDAARTQLLGQVRDLADWQRLLDERFSRRGAYVVQAGDFDWTAVDDDSSYVPALEAGSGADAWHPEDALFVPMRHTAGHLLGILSVDEPMSRRRPTDEELDVLVALDGSRSACGAVRAGSGRGDATQGRARAAARGLVPPARRACR